MSRRLSWAPRLLPLGAELVRRGAGEVGISPPRQPVGPRKLHLPRHAVGIFREVWQSFFEETGGMDLEGSGWIWKMCGCHYKAVIEENGLQGILALTAARWHHNAPKRPWVFFGTPLCCVRTSLASPMPSTALCLAIPPRTDSTQKLFWFCAWPHGTKASTCHCDFGQFNPCLICRRTWPKSQRAPAQASLIFVLASSTHQSARIPTAKGYTCRDMSATAEPPGAVLGSGDACIQTYIFFW